MDTTKIANQPDRCLATEVELWDKGDGTLHWCDDECTICGGENIYPAGNHKDDPRHTLGYRTPLCAKPELGSPFAIVAKALNLSFHMVALIEAEPTLTVNTLKTVRPMGPMGIAGLLESAVHGDNNGGEV